MNKNIKYSQNFNIKYSQNFLTSEKVLNQIIKQLNLWLNNINNIKMLESELEEKKEEKEEKENKWYHIFKRKK